MSTASPDVEAIRRIFEDFSSLRALDDEEFGAFAERCWDPEIEYEEDPKWPGSGRYRGREQVVRAWLDYIEILGRDVRAELVDVLDGQGTVVVLLRIFGESAGERVPFDNVWGYHCELRDGRLARFRAYFDSDEALAAAGVSR